jgi:hypothetical protein
MDDAGGQRFIRIFCLLLNDHRRLSRVSVIPPWQQAADIRVGPGLVLQRTTGQGWDHFTNGRWVRRDLARIGAEAIADRKITDDYDSKGDILGPISSSSNTIAPQVREPFRPHLPRDPSYREKHRVSRTLLYLIGKSLTKCTGTSEAVRSVRPREGFVTGGPRELEMAP